jgi:hypothetical protein
MVKFWQIEEIDHKPIMSREHERCEKQFLECHKRLANGKFQVPLMFKSESPNIGLSFDQALKRFQSQTDSDRWYHVKGEENLADIISRGLLPSQLRNSKLWFHGPSWLYSHPDTWRCNHIQGVPKKEDESITPLFIGRF